MDTNLFAQIHMSYPELITCCDSVQSFMVRDTTEFAGFAVDITAFLTKIMDMN